MTGSSGSSWPRTRARSDSRAARRARRALPLLRAGHRGQPGGRRAARDPRAPRRRPRLRRRHACTARGVAVTITPQGVTHPMASAAADARARAGTPAPRARPRAPRLGLAARGALRAAGDRASTGRTLGVIGYGRIGREIVRLLAPWGMRVLVTQRTPVADEDVSYVALEQLLVAADVVVVACPLTDETRGLLDARRLATDEARRALLVNVARGAIVDQACARRRASRSAASAAPASTSSTPSRCRPTIRCSSCRTSSARPTRSATPIELLRECVGGACDGAARRGRRTRAPRTSPTPPSSTIRYFAAKLDRFAATPDDKGAS